MSENQTSQSRLSLILVLSQKCLGLTALQTAWWEGEACNTASLSQKLISSLVQQRKCIRIYCCNTNT